jgi:CheY-like chemotaxis protein
VLVVDDTAWIRFIIRTNLELAGFDVDEAVDGVDCLEILGRTSEMPDAITVDVMMPRMDGVATVAAIRADPRTAKIAIVMVSTQGYPADIARGMEAGVNAYITKPFDPDFMVATVSDVIEGLKGP